MDREGINNHLLPKDSPTRSYNRWLALLVAVFLISTIILAVFLGVEKGKTTPTPKPGSTTTAPPQPSNDTTCLTPYCIKAADYLLDSIDETVNPCEDFYQFACGAWLKTARIPEETGVQNIFNQLDDQLDSNLIDLLSSPPSDTNAEPNAVINARNLYNSCLNESAIEVDGVEPILSIINNEFGGWPILLGGKWNASTFNLTNLLLKLREYDDGIIYSVATAVNQENSSVYDIELAQGTLGLEETEYYNNETDITAAYRQFIIDLASALTNETGAIATDAISIFLIEKNISQYHWTDTQQRDRDNETIRTTIGDLHAKFPSMFDFTHYLREAYLIGNVTLLDTDLVTVSEPAYLINVSLILTQNPPTVVQNYLIWRFMMNRASSMPKRIRSTREQFDRVFKGTSAEPTRSTTCANYVNDNMGFAVSRLYIKKYFDDNARNQSKEIIKNIRSSMLFMLQNASWMDEDSKAKALDKEKAIYENIGYPDYVASDNTTQLEKMYAEYVFDEKSYVSNILLMQRVKAQEDFRTLREVVDHRAWGDLPPTVVNAFYEPSTNAISFPAGILQMPYFNKDAPKYLNYGGIGMVIGHEITHGFDDDGRQYDKDGNKVPWWSNSTITAFNERKQCIIDQYSNYTVEQIHKNLNGEQTQGENIADNGGIKSSFYAYQNWVKENPNVDKRLPGLNKYTEEQLFFIGYAHGWCAKFTDAYALHRVLTDVHSIPRFRVIGPLSNFAEFDRVFSCTPGQGSSRVKKCAVW